MFHNLNNIRFIIQTYLLKTHEKTTNIRGEEELLSA